MFYEYFLATRINRFQGCQRLPGHAHGQRQRRQDHVLGAFDHLQTYSNELIVKKHA